MIDYDKSKFDSFGIIKNKKLFLKRIEAEYLIELGYLDKSIEDKYQESSLKYLYGYLRRAGKIVQL